MQLAGGAGVADRQGGGRHHAVGVPIHPLVHVVVVPFADTIFDELAHLGERGQIALERRPADQIRQVRMAGNALAFARPVQGGAVEIRGGFFRGEGFGERFVRTAGSRLRNNRIGGTEPAADETEPGAQDQGKGSRHDRLREKTRGDDRGKGGSQINARGANERTTRGRLSGRFLQQVGPVRQTIERVGVQASTPVSGLPSGSRSGGSERRSIWYTRDACGFFHTSVPPSATGTVAVKSPPGS